jgi:ATP-dependent DNA helicase RecQ
MSTPEKVLKEVFGFPAFRPPQKEVIERSLNGEHSLVLMPTGMGKSLCFQIPSQILPGITLVLSPLIALMKDQVDQALGRGIKSAFINSSLQRNEREQRYKQLSRGEFRLLYVTPERFRKPEFVEALKNVKISLLVKPTAFLNGAMISGLITRELRNFEVLWETRRPKL